MCGCSSTSNTNTGEQVVVKKTYNDKTNRYNLTPVYLKVDNEYLYIDVYWNKPQGSDSWKPVVELNRTETKNRTKCIELIQYDKYFTITIATYYVNDPESTEEQQLNFIKYDFTVHNNIGSYEIEKY
ncbi:MAG: hypothetical protein J6V44_16325 [Methanobrevibacter sp.]|nr:hypothetical protein [Methanobrevibacter sp.]